MVRTELLEELKRLPLGERLAFLEAALDLIREDLQRIKKPYTQTEDKKRQLAAAAEALLPDYTAGGELTAFTNLDSEDFHAEG